MWPTWLQAIARKILPFQWYRLWIEGRVRFTNLGRPRFVPQLEQVEDRVTPATITWDGGAGTLSWADAKNWSGDVVPTSVDDVIIPDLGTLGVADLTINLSTNSVSAQSITTFENLSSSNITLTGGNIAINNAATLTLTGNAGLRFNASSAAVNQQITTTGGGTIALNNGDLEQFGTAHTVTVGPGVSITGAGRIGLTGGGRPTGGTWHNFGTWTATTTANGTTLALQASNTFVNQPGGTWGVSTGTLTMDGSWTSHGTIAVSGGTLNLGGSFTGADLGTWVRSGGTVNLTGTLDNTGTTLVLDTATTGYGTWNVTTGTIVGGNVQTANDRQLVLGNSSSLSGVTIDAGSDVTTSMTGGGTITVTNGLTVNGRITLGANGFVRLNGTQTLGGTGDILFTASGSGLWLNQEGMTLTIGSGMLIHGNSSSGGIRNNSTGFINTTVLNSGTIDADVVGGSITLGANNFINTSAGRLNASVGTLTVASSVWTNQGSATVLSGTLTIAPTDGWSNTGTINVTGGTLNLGGNFSSSSVSDPGRFARTGGTVNITGTVNNVGQEFILDGAPGGTGTFNLDFFSSIQGGTITTRNGAILRAPYFNSSNPDNNLPVLNTVSISAGSEVAVNGARVRLQGAINLEGKLTLNTGTVEAIVYGLVPCHSSNEG